MARLQSSRVVPIILVIVIAIVLIAALVSVARVIFGGNSSTDTPAASDTSRAELLNTSEGHSVSMVVRGPIVADESFRTYRIEISPNSRQLVTYNGYLDRAQATVNLGNSVASYEEFVHALDKANLSLGQELTGEANDLRGRCATGRVYEFAINTYNDPVKSLWTSSCKNSAGSLEASAEQIRALFLAQIPDAQKTIRTAGF